MCRPGVAKPCAALRADNDPEVNMPAAPLVAATDVLKLAIVDGDGDRLPKVLSAGAEVAGVTFGESRSTVPSSCSLLSRLLLLTESLTPLTIDGIPVPLAILECSLELAFCISAWCIRPTTTLRLRKMESVRQSEGPVYDGRGMDAVGGSG